MFKPFAQAINAKFNEFTKEHNLFVVALADKDELYNEYLAAFPEGTNPIYKTNTEHDCDCCKNFIRNIGKVVRIKNGVIDSVWNVEGLPHPYNIVAERLHKLVISKSVSSVFMTGEFSFGKESNNQVVEVDGKHTTLVWNHFWAHVPARFRPGNYATVRGNRNENKQTLQRALTELPIEAAETVLKLITENKLTRGNTYKTFLGDFIKLKQQSEGKNLELFCWENASNALGCFRNSLIGTLVSDIAGGMPVNAAIRAYENKASAENYMRTTAPVSQSAAQQAVATLETLGLTSALERRPAVISDVSVHDVLWASSDAVSAMKAPSVTDTLLAVAKQATVKNITGANTTLEDFVANILPTAKKLEVLFEQEKKNNLVALTAPVHKDAGKLFKWDNGFAWSYTGGFADSIKERVKEAGGNVDAKLRVSLAWYNTDDLDIHANCPDGHIFYGRKHRILDVDMNAGWRDHSNTPVENLAWVFPHDGKYSITVDMYTKRNSSNSGYAIQLQFEDQTLNWSSQSSPRSSKSDEVLNFSIKNGKLCDLKVSENLKAEVTGGKALWGVNPSTFVEVTSVMKSPNHWHGQSVGHKHWFFILKDCVPTEAVRSIYPEYLTQELHEHRRVFELLGDLAKCDPSADQLAGLGFNETSQAVVTVRVTDDTSTRVYHVKFN